MKTIAIWGQRNPLLARLIILLSHILLIALSVIWGCQLYENGMHANPIFAYGFLGLFFIVFWLYPIRKNRQNLIKDTFYNRKKCDAILIVSVMMSISVFCNHSLYNPPVAQFIVHQTQPSSPPSFIKKTHRKQIKWLGKQLTKHVLSSAKNGTDKNKPILTFGKFMALLLSILLAGILVSLLAALSCNLSCSGNGILAIIVFVVGFLGVIYLTASLFRRILRKSSKAYKRSEIEIDEKDPDKDLYFQ